MPNSEENIQKENIKEETADECAKQAAEDTGSGAEESGSAAEAAEDTSANEGKSADAGSEPADSGEQEQSEGTDSEEEPQEKAGSGDKPGGDDKKDRKLFRKKEKKKDKKDEKIEELSDRLVRQMAEFDNYRKRTEKEKAANYVIGARDVIEKLLPVVDNFERGLADANLEDPFADGMDKVYKQLTTLLEGLGVEPIEAVGKEFDPNLHNAVMHIDDEDLGENVIAEEFQKGYTYKGQVVRHSMVKVAN